MSIVLGNKQHAKANVRKAKKNTILVNQTFPSVATSLNQLTDVDLNHYQMDDGSLLIYDETEGKFLPATLLEKQIINGGNF